MSSARVVMLSCCLQSIRMQCLGFNDCIVVWRIIFSFSNYWYSWTSVSSYTGYGKFDGLNDFYRGLNVTISNSHFFPHNRKLFWPFTMVESITILKSIAVTPAEVSDGAHNSRGVKKYECNHWTIYHTSLECNNAFFIFSPLYWYAHTIWRLR